jgi:hypothetical protein
MCQVAITYYSLPCSSSRANTHNFESRSWRSCIQPVRSGEECVLPRSSMLRFERSLTYQRLMRSSKRCFHLSLMLNIAVIYITFRFSVFLLTSSLRKEHHGSFKKWSTLPPPFSTYCQAYLLANQVYLSNPEYESGSLLPNIQSKTCGSRPLWPDE